jgi:hypothetical protein
MRPIVSCTAAVINRKDSQIGDQPVSSPVNPPDNLGGDDFGIGGGNQAAGRWADSGADQPASGDSGDFLPHDQGGAMPSQGRGPVGAARLENLGRDLDTQSSTGPLAE